MIRGAKIGREYDGVYADNVGVHPGIAAAWKNLMGILDGRVVSVFMSGPPGTGKTRMIAAILHEADRRWPLGIYVYYTMPELSEARRRAIGNSSIDPIELCSDAHIVAIDDLGAEMVNEYSLDGLYRILDHRRKNQKPTIVATNLDPDKLSKIYGDRIVSRLVGERGVAVKVTGADWRIRQTLRSVEDGGKI